MNSFTVSEHTDIYRSKKASGNGFTLLETLIAILIFGVIVTTAYGSYRSIATQTQTIRAGITPYEMASRCLNRMKADLESIYITLQPEYKVPGFNADPEPFRITCGSDPSGLTNFSILRFTSCEHLSFGEKQQTGIAEIVYYVEETDNTTYVLKRADHLYPYPLFEKKKTDPVLCKDIRSIKYKFHDAEDNDHDSWDSDAQDHKYATPHAVSILLEIGNKSNVHFFETRVLFPVIRQAIK